MFDLIDITLIDVIDILLVALLIYEIIRLVKGTSAVSIIAGIITLYVIWIVVTALNMKLLSSILERVLGVGVLALIVIFQNEIRRFLFHFGATYHSAKNTSLFRKIFRSSSNTGIRVEVLDELTAACRKMADSKTGALIVMRHSSSLSNYVETGDEIGANISSRLIENIFFKNTPLHDGAMIISKDKIIAARCTLPVSGNMNIPPRYGMRHRAAAGVTEVSDATAIVVSEETGEISFVVNGIIKQMSSLTELRLAIENSYK